MTDYLKSYFGALSSVDDSLSRILHYLQETDIADETVLVFYSDNGFMIGDHGLIDKRAGYQASVLVPMIVYAPGLVPAGISNPTRVRNLDLAPTFLDIAGLEAPQEFEGKSAWPVITGALDRESWGEPDFVYQYFWEWSFPMTPTTFAIQRGDLKYIQYHGVWDIEELYNLNADPAERFNLINEPRYYTQRQSLRHALYDAIAGASGEHEVPFTKRLAEGMNLRDRNGENAAPFPDWWRVTLNRPDRYNGLLPDTPAKKKALDAGRPYIPWLEPQTNDSSGNRM